MEHTRDGSLARGLTRVLCVIVVAILLVAAVYSAVIAVRDFPRINV